jgi:lipoprotein-releasing system permease protein
MTKHLKILEYSISALWRRKYRNLSVVAAFSFTVAILASILFLTHSLKTEASIILLGAPELTVQSLSAGRHELIPEDYIREISRIPGTGRVKARYWGYYYDALTEANYTLMGVAGSVDAPLLLEGRLPAGPGECAIGRGVSEARLTGLDEELILVDSRGLGTPFQVTGLFTSPSSILTNDLVLMSEDQVKEFFGLPAGRATDIIVQVHNPNEVQTVAAKIKRRLPDTRPIPRSELLRTYDAVFNWRSGMMLMVFSAALVAFGILAWDKATGLSGEEKREIGILKAVGWDTSDILELKFWEGIVISATSLFLGLTVAFIHVFFLGAAAISPVIKGWSVVFPDFELVPYIDIYQILMVGFLTIVPYVASTIIPSWKSAATDPESIMRS